MRQRQQRRLQWGMFLFGLLGLFWPAVSAWAATRNVPTADYPTIQAGIDAAVSGDTVLLADGTYKGAGNKDLDFKGKAITVKSANGPEKTVIDCEGSGRGFYFHSKETAKSVIDGFTIKNGKVDYIGGGIYCENASPTITNCTISGNSANYGGGGIGCEGMGFSPTITNCTINNNSAGYGGGGIGCEYSSPKITNCTITHNTAGNGGGIVCYFSLSPQITNCTITHNTANDTGGGILCFSASPIITNCTISDNNASSGDGGGIWCYQNCSPQITNCTISDNSAGRNGGGIHCEDDCLLTVTNCTIKGNSAGHGGGIYCENYTKNGWSPTITNCTITANNAIYSGGGIYLNYYCSPKITECTITDNDVTGSFGTGGGICLVDNCSPQIINCTITGNHADSTYSEGGGGIACYYSAPIITNCLISGNSTSADCGVSGGNGGGILCSGYPSPTITNSTISGNSASNNGGGIYCEYESSPSVVNSILWGDTAAGKPDEVFLSGSSIAITFSNIEGGWYGTGNINDDPLFAQPCSASKAPSAAGDYHLRPSSPCIDLGTSANAPSQDIDNDSRPFGSGYDMGADEYNGGSVAAFSANPCSGLVPLKVYFTDESSPSATSWDWDFGDGHTSTEQHPAHTYEKSGQYTVSLTITGPNGTDTATYKDYILASAIRLVPAEYSTIQAAIDAAADDDIVRVADGTYRGTGNKDLDFKGKRITVQSENGPEHTIIDCEGIGRGFYFNKSETAESVVDGFTIINGKATDGGGIYCYSSPTITNCIISGNSASSTGGGISCYNYSSPTIINCIISGNSAAYGSGIYCYKYYMSCSSPTIINCAISGNSAINSGGGIYCKYSDPAITNSTISGNSAVTGGGIYCDHSSPTITNCTISGNRASSLGGGIYYSYYNSSWSPKVVNSILWGDTAAGSPNEIYLDNSSITVSYSNIQDGFTGTGNINSDPLFVDPRTATNAPTTAGDYHLQASSPCIDKGTPDDAPTSDIDGNIRPNGGYDMGSDEYYPPTVAAFTANPLSGNSPLLVAFTDTSTGIITSYSWDFGDGSTSTEKNPFHTYSTCGPHAVSLMISGPGGSDTELKANYITINCPPTLGTLTPTPITTEQGKTQTFTTVYSDANGYANLSAAYLLVSPTGGTTSAIWTRYDRAVNKLYLYNDAGSATVSGSCTPGVAATLSNTQGSLNCAQTTVTGSGTNLTVNWNLTPKSGFASTTAKQVRTNVKDNSNASTGWVTKGSWTILAANAAPTLGSLTPTPITTEQGKPQTFTAVYSDANGYANLSAAYLLVSPTCGTTSAIWTRYDRAVNKLYLYNDAGTATVSGSCTPGVAATLSNTQGSLNCGQTTVTGSGANLTVNWNLTPKSGFASSTAKQVRMNVKDNSGASTGWVTKGSWTILAANAAPTLGSLTPTPITTEQGKPQTFTTVYSDANGYANLSAAYLLVSPTGGTTSAIWTRYDRAVNKLYLYNDAGTATVSGSCTPGIAATLSNTQGSLNCAQTKVTGSGTNLTVNWNLTPKSGFASTMAKQVRMNVKDNSNASTGWVTKGNWTITAVSSATTLDANTTQAFGIFRYGIINAIPQSSHEDKILAGDNKLGISPDKDITIMESDYSNRPDDVTLELAIKKSKGMTADDLNGTYTVVQHTVLPDQAEDPAPVVVRYEFTFDGKGGIGIVPLDRIERVTDLQKNTTYAIEPDGSITIPGFSGQVSPESEIIVLVADGERAGKKKTPGRPTIILGMRQGGGKNIASLTGEYEVTWLKNTLVNSSIDWSRQQDLVSFDGKGFCYSTAENAGVYSIADDGTMVVFGIDGMVSNDNQWTIFLDIDKSDGDLGIGLGELR